MYYDTTEEQYSLSESRGIKTKPFEKAAVLHTPCSQLINPELMNAKKQWITHMKEANNTQKYTHKTQEWIKMLPSGSGNDSPPGLDDEYPGIRKQVDPLKAQIGIYGWRKKCLFTLIVVLIMLVIMNICITLWIMEVLNFSMKGGVGALRIVKGGVVMKGKTYFMDKLVASNIASRPGGPLSFVTPNQLSFSIRNHQGREVSNFYLKNNSVTMATPSFNIINPKGEVLFSANKNGTVFGNGEVTFTGASKIHIDGTLETSSIRGQYKRDLSIESVTRFLEIFGTRGIVLDSHAGDISVSCLRELKFSSSAGGITLDGSKLFMPRLPIANTTIEKSSLAGQYNNGTIVYQVCICENGNMFLALPTVICAADNDVCH